MAVVGLIFLNQLDNLLGNETLLLHGCPFSHLFSLLYLLHPKNGNLLLVLTIEDDHSKQYVFSYFLPNVLGGFKSKLKSWIPYLIS